MKKIIFVMRLRKPRIVSYNRDCRRIIYPSLKMKENGNRERFVDKKKKKKNKTGLKITRAQVTQQRQQ